MPTQHPSITYIGSFPPPYGGVTIKNALLYHRMSERIPLRKLDLARVKQHNPKACASFLKCIFSKKGALVLGVAGNWRRRLTNILHMFNRAKMRRSVLIVMGGEIIKDESYIAKLNCFKQVFVETNTMKHEFEKFGARNISVYPNCRPRHKISSTPRKTTENKIGAVFFSLVCKEKGADIILDAARNLPDVSFHFYGEVERNYKESFFEAVNAIANVQYHGVFDSLANDPIEELRKYDVHLFPTLWTCEGVPGVVVETKIAGIPTIATSVAHNSELIEDGCTGLLMGENTSDELVRLLKLLLDNPDHLNLMKQLAENSAEEYYIDNYLDSLIDEFSVSD